MFLQSAFAPEAAAQSFVSSTGAPGGAGSGLLDQKARVANVERSEFKGKHAGEEEEKKTRGGVEMRKDF